MVIKSRPDLPASSWGGLLASIILLILSPASLAASFAATQALDANPFSDHILSVDMDGINGPDLVLVDDSSNTLSVLLNKGGGSFSPKVDYGTGNEPIRIASCDIDGVNGLDILTSNSQDDTISIFTNNGEGELSPKVEIAVGEMPFGIQCGDVDGINGPDVVIAYTVEDYISVLLNKGDGTFERKVDYSSAFSEHIYLADVDGVHGIDILTANTSADTVSVHINNGNGTFKPKVDYTVKSGSISPSPRSITVSDIDGGNGPEIIIANYSSKSIFILFNNGSGVFDESDEIFTPLKNIFVTTADIDGENGTDLIYIGYLTSSLSKVHIQLNNGDGTFGSIETYLLKGPESSLAIADVDGKNGLDVISENSAAILLNNGDGTFPRETSYSMRSYPFVLLSQDIDGINGPDLISGHNLTNNIVVRLNDGLGGFGASKDYIATSGNVTSSVSSYDIDGTNGFDIVTADAINNSFSILLNNGDGTFANYQEYITNTGPNDIGTADIDGKNGGDVIISYTTGNIFSIFANDGTGTFSTKKDYATNPGAQKLAVADVDGKNGPDVLLTTSDLNTVSIYINDGDGHFSTGSDYATGTGPAFITTADLKGTGSLDLIIANNNSNDVSVLLNNGDGTFAEKTDYHTGNKPISINAIDVDGLNGLDLVIANADSDTLSILLNQGGGEFEKHKDFVTPNYPTSVLGFDIDGSNGPDLLTANFGTGGVSVMLNTTDLIPDDFQFEDVLLVDKNILVESELVNISGLEGATEISISGGEYRLNDGDWSNTPKMVINGDYIRVRHLSSSKYNSTTNTELLIGGVSDIFSSTTISDIHPDPFTFTDISDVPPSTLVESETLRVIGLLSSSLISVDKGMYRVNNGSYTSKNGFISNGDSIQVRLMSPEYFGETSEATLDIGGVSDTFSVTTISNPTSDKNSTNDNGSLKIGMLSLIAFVSLAKLIFTCGFFQVARIKG